MTKVNFFPKYSIVQRDTSMERNSIQKPDSNTSAQKDKKEKSAHKNRSAANDGKKRSAVKVEGKTSSAALKKRDREEKQIIGT